MKISREIRLFLGEILICWALMEYAGKILADSVENDYVNSPIVWVFAIVWVGAALFGVHFFINATKKLNEVAKQQDS